MKLISFAARVAGIVFISVLSHLEIYAQAKTTYANLEDAIRSSGMLLGNTGPESVNWINGGRQYSFLQANGIYVMDPATLREDKVFGSNGVTLPGTANPFSYESFEWSQDSKHLVFKTNTRQIYRQSGISDYYLYDVAAGQLKQAAKDARSAQLSPDGGMVGIERGGNMYVYDFASGKEKQLTNDGTSEGDIFNGHYDWVYEEEFGQPVAWNWSPDSRYIAFWQFDEHKVPVFQMTNFEGLHPQQVMIPIPQPGDINPTVRIGVTDVHTGHKVWLTPDETGDFYIPRIYWTADPDVLALMTLNRAQNHMKLYFFNVHTGQHRVVLEEKNDNWVTIFNFYTQVNDMVYFPEKTREFFWVSDRSGYYHVYRYNYDGKLLNQVTTGDWDMIKVTGINAAEKKIYYLSAEASPLEQQLYAIKFDGTGKVRLTQTAGYHDINMSPDAKYYIDSYSNINLPVRISLNNNKGRTLKMLEENQPVRNFISSHFYSPAELFQFKTSDGVTIDGSIIKPMGFDPAKKYPVVMTVYGGPESHSVFNRFSTGIWQQWLAQNGYMVVDINNRGVANYGSKFMKVVYKQLGKWESNDFAEAARYLSALPYVDGRNIAIEGSSYGGYSTVYTLATHPGVFKAGIANSAVTDWRLYDDIYTERYMAPLADNRQGYISSSVMTHAKSLTDHLLLIHSMSDDNVHPANTMQLLTALTNAGKDVDLRIYPPGAHGAAYNYQSYLLIKQTGFDYLEKWLKGK